MVGLNPAIRELCKDSKLSTPTDPTDLFLPRLNDLPLSLDDPFPDFDSIKDWNLEPDSVQMPIDGIEVENPDGSVPKEVEFGSSEETYRKPSIENPCPGGSDLKTARIEISEENNQIEVENPDGSVPKSGEFGFSEEIYREIKIENPCRGGSDLKRSPVGISEETHQRIGTDREAGVGNGSDSTKVIFGVLDASIENEMEKVSLLGACNDISVDSDIADCEEGDDSVMIEQCKEMLMSKEKGDGESVVTMSDTKVNMDSNITEKSDVESGEIVSDKDECDSGISESSDSNDSSSASSSEEDEDTDDDDDDDDEKMGEDVEVEEGEIRNLNREDIVLSSGDEGEGGMKGPVKSKNELEVLPPVPLVDVVLEPHHQTLPVGIILSIMGTKVVVEGGEKHNPLNEGSILWVTETRLPLGLIDEIFGPVKNPYYVIRYNSEKEAPSVISEGTAVSFVAEFASHILNDKTLYKKGYDASGDNDEEVSDVGEFSDDEKEAEFRRLQRMAKRGKDDRKQGNREFFGQKKAQVKGGFHKNVQRSVPPSPGSVGPPGPTGGGLKFVLSTVQGPSLSMPLGCGSCGCSHGAGQVGASVPPMGYPGGPPPHLLLQSNSIWSNGMPVQQQQMCSPSGFPMNGMQHEQYPDHYHHHHQHQHQHQLQMFAGFPNGMPCQPQFNPSQMPLPTVAQPFGNPYVGPTPTSLNGTMGIGCFNQMPFEMGIQSQGHYTHLRGGIGEQRDSSNGQLPPSIVQVGFSATQQFNHGRASNRGRRRPPRGSRSNFSGGRGPQQTG